MKRKDERTRIFRMRTKSRNTGVVIIFSVITLLFILAVFFILRTPDTMAILP